MRLPFQRSKNPAADRGARPGDETAAVEQARTRARRRLSGALVLLLTGVIGFPLLFETQPRPLPVDTPIEVRAGELASPSPRTLPAPAPAPVPDARGAATPDTTSADAAPAGSAATTEPPPSRMATPAPTPTIAAASAAAPVEAPATTRAAAESAPAAPAVSRSDDGARARALLEGGATAQAAARFVVQVGAYSDAEALRQARQKVERLGMKTYTQVVDTSAGKRTRVRIGPFASRAEADAAAARLKSAGLPASILAL